MMGGSKDVSVSKDVRKGAGKDMGVMVMEGLVVRS